MRAAHRTGFFLRSPCVNTHDHDPMEVDVVAMKWKEKGKENHSGKGYVEQNSWRFLDFDGACRNCGKYGHNAADFWQKSPMPQGKGEGKAKSKVSAVGESERSIHVEETWTFGSSSQQSGSSRVNTIRTVACADECLWFSFLTAKQYETPQDCVLGRKVGLSFTSRLANTS